MRNFYIFWMIVVFSLQLSAQEYCIPTYGSSSGWEYIRDFSTTGGDTNISNLGSGSSSGTAYYGDFTAMSVTAGQGTSFDFSLTYQYAGSNGVGFKIWVDWNNDFTFSEDEIVFFEFPAEDEDASDGASVVTVSGSISIPSDAVEGNHRMRVRSFDGFISDIDACQNGFWGESEDYTVTVTASTSLSCTDGYMLSESFENQWLPNGWDLDQTNVSQTWNKTYYHPDFNFDGEYAADIQYDPNLELQDEWLILPSLDLTTSFNPRLEFITRLSYYWAVEMDTYDLEVQLSTDNGTIWTKIWDESALGVFDQYANHMVYLDLNEYSDESNVKIAFRYHGTDGAFAVVDSVKISCCSTPLNVEINDITLTNATVTWESTASNFEVEYGEQGFTQGTGTIVSVNSNSVTLEDLSSATAYDIYIRSVCNEDVKSDWTEVTQFITRFESVELPYCYGFEDNDGWVIENNTLSQNPVYYNGMWSIQPNNGAYIPSEGNFHGRYTYSATSQADSWFFSRGLNLTAGQEITISFDYRAGMMEYPENLALTIGNEPTALAQGTTLWSEEGFSNNFYESTSATYTATSDGVYYLGFHAYSDADAFFIFIDNICIEESEMSVNDEGTINVSIFPNPVNDILNISTNKSVANVAVFDLTGKKLISDARITNGQMNVSALNPGTYILRVKLEDGQVETFKIMKK